MDELFLITGGAGYLGNTLVRELLKEKKKIRILVFPGEKNIPQGDIEVFYGDVLKPQTMEAFFENDEKKDLIVIHTAGIVSIASKYQQKIYDVNVIGTKNIIALCQAHRVKKMIYISSVHAIPEKKKGQTITEVTAFDPDAVVGLYAKTKAEATNLVLEAAKKGLDARIVHPSGICGPFDEGRGYLTTLVIHYYTGKLTAALNGGYDFVDVRDVAKGIILCLEKGKKGETYILSNRYFSIKEMLKMLHQITGKKEVKRILPAWFIRLMAPLAERYYRIIRQPPLFTAYSIYTLNSNAIFSHEKATRELGYQTRAMTETLNDTIDWLKANGRLE